MCHSVFTIVDAVRREALPTLRHVLSEIEQDHRGNPHVPFAALPALHFASFTIFDEEGTEVDPFLVFENNVDGDIADYLAQLVTVAMPGLIRIYACCGDFPITEPDEREMSAYLRRHSHQPDLYHIGTPFRVAGNIVAERHLRQLVEQESDSLTVGSAGRPPSWVWQRLREAVRAPTSATRHFFPIFAAETGEVSWLPNPERRWMSRFVSWSTFALLAALALTPLIGLNLVFWHRPLLLTAALTFVFSALGAWTSILIGWPALERWRDPVNICAWFAIAGWTVSILPGLARLANVGWSRQPAAVGPALLGLLSVAVLGFMVGRWMLPTPDLDHRKPDCERLMAVLAQEDRDVQNHMSALVLLRPGWLRLLALRALLWIQKLTWFPTILRDVEGGRLFGLPTVHFAQWITLDRGRYIFLSNYDHSWSRYLNDFGTISFGLARLWGQGQRSPGLASIERFKDFARGWMVPYSVWYRAYPGLTVTQIWNNERIRVGLLAPADDQQSLRLLRRLVAAEDR